MRELSLFSGAGGGLLGTKLMGWTHCGYVEYNDYCQRVIRQRILDGILENAPIFGDIRAFLNEGYAASYQGMVDIVTAGFPCQPFSVAGKQQGEDDSRNMWPETLAVLREVRPQYALLENVPGLLAHEYGRRIFADLAESGFDARWRVLSAAECGAPHKRDRVWILADTPRKLSNVSELHGEYSECEVPESGDNGSQMADPGSQGLQGATCRQVNSIREPERAFKGGEFMRRNATQGCYWASEPDVGRVANGVASRVDRLKALGNGQVPAVVRAAWELLG